LAQSPGPANGICRALLMGRDDLAQVLRVQTRGERCRADNERPGLQMLAISDYCFGYGRRKDAPHTSALRPCNSLGPFPCGKRSVLPVRAKVWPGSLFIRAKFGAPRNWNCGPRNGAPLPPLASRERTILLEMPFGQPRMALSSQEDEFVEVASAALPRIVEIIAAFPTEDRSGALEVAERRYTEAARRYGCTQAETERWVAAIMRRLRTGVEEKSTGQQPWVDR
jgi:hypothetical protein